MKQNTIIISILLPKLFMSFYFAGGFLCFDIFEEDVIEWQGKLAELEGVGILESVTKKKVPLCNVEGVQIETNAFVFKILRN